MSKKEISIRNLPGCAARSAIRIFSITMFSEVRFNNQLINSCSEIGETKTICKGGSLKKEEEIGYFIQ